MGPLWFLNYPCRAAPYEKISRLKNCLSSITFYNNIDSFLKFTHYTFLRTCRSLNSLCKRILKIIIAVSRSWIISLNDGFSGFAYSPNGPSPINTNKPFVILYLVCSHKLPKRLSTLLTPFVERFESNWEHAWTSDPCMGDL